MKKLFLLLLGLVTVAAASAQSHTVTGIVLQSSDSEPVIGASVVPVGGGKLGVATDIDGKFTLTLPVSVKQLMVSSIGMVTKTVNVEPTMRIYLDNATTRLDEVVVTGYGSGKKLGSVVGSVNVVNSQAFEDSPAPNIVDALQGQVPGLAIYSNSGEPASLPSNIRIRGTNSLNASTTPLFILDGSPVTSSVLSSLNSSDIESITVLKDAASTSIYGSRAANGVIVITTKKGKYGENAKVTIRANYGWSARVQDKIKMMNSAQYIKFRDMINVPVTDAERDAWELYGVDTNWDDALISSTAPTYSLEGAVQGGSDKLSYYISLSHYDQDGLIKSSGFRREALRASLDSKVNDWFRVGFQSNLSYQKYQSNGNITSSGNYVMLNPFLQAKELLPYDTPYYYTIKPDANGVMRKVYGDKAKYYMYSGLVDAQYLTTIQPSSRNEVTATLSLYEAVTPIKGLTFMARQAVDAYDYRSTARTAPQGMLENPMGPGMDLSSLVGRRSESFSRSYQFTYTNTLEYKFNLFERFNVTALAGQESVIQKGEGFGVATEGQPNKQQLLLTNGTKITIDNVSQSMSEMTINSYFFNLGLDWDNRYFLDLSYRRDGSSKFAPGHRWANFYSVGAMWNLKGEKFLSEKSWLDDLKLRVSYGTTGNSGISNYLWVGTVGTGGAYNDESSLGIANPSNTTLTWETVTNFDAGITFNFLNSKLYGTVDYYIKNTKDMLMSLPWSLSTGFGSGYTNVGNMRNTGFDAELGTALVNTRDWYFGARFNINYNDNYITKLFDGRDNFVVQGTGIEYRVGVNPFNLHAVRYAGVDPRDGKQMWYTKEGNLTKTYNVERDAVDLKKSFRAPWTGGFGIDARWKNLSLRADFMWAADKYIFECTAQSLRDAQEGADGTNQVVEMLNVWTKPGDKTLYPNANETVRFDTRYLQNASFVRMKNLTIQYSLPKTWMEKIRMQSIILHFTGRNLLTFTTKDFTGADPEYEGNIVRFEYPNTRQYEFGVEVTF